MAENHAVLVVSSIFKQLTQLEARTLHLCWAAGGTVSSSRSRCLELVLSEKLHRLRQPLLHIHTTACV